MNDKDIDASARRAVSWLNSKYKGKRLLDRHPYKGQHVRFTALIFMGVGITAFLLIVFAIALGEEIDQFFSHWRVQLYLTIVLTAGLAGFGVWALMVRK